jgi:membrane associated rhomboid family serine protease
MPTTTSYSFDLSRLALRLAFLGLVAVVMGFATVFLHDISPVMRAFFALTTTLLAVLVVISFPQLFDGKPALVVSDEGVMLPRLANERVDWSRVTEVRRTKYGRAELLSFTVDAETAKHLTRPIPARFFGWRQTLSVPLALFDGSGDEIAAECERRWRAACRAEPDSAHAAEREPRGAPTLNRPWLTYVLLAILAAVYACELVFAVTPSKAGSPSVVTLAYLGGNLGNRIWQSSEWWRLFTAPLLHGGALHILLNGFVLWAAGTALEKLVGWRWLGAIFVLSALGGSLGSLAVNPPNVVGVGASGGIMGLLAALFVMTWRLPAGVARQGLQSRAVRTILPALLPGVSAGSSGVTIDYAAHGGGLITGALVAMALLRAWPKDRKDPPLGIAAACVAGAYFVVAADSVVFIVNLYPKS